MFWVSAFGISVSSAICSSAPSICSIFAVSGLLVFSECFGWWSSLWFLFVCLWFLNSLLFSFGSSLLAFGFSVFNLCFLFCFFSALCFWCEALQTTLLVECSPPNDPASPEELILPSLRPCEQEQWRSTYLLFEDHLLRVLLDGHDRSQVSRTSTSSACKRSADVG